MFTKLMRIGNEPEVKFIPSGTAVMSLSLAYQYGQKGNDGKKPTQWIEASMWGKQAEALQPYLKKGDQVSVSIDDLHIETYQKKDGTEGFKLSGRIAAFDFVAGSKPEGGQAQPSQSPAAKPVPRNTGFDDFDNDSIPF